MRAPYRILSLVEMCSDNRSEKRDVEGYEGATLLAAGWLRSNPGRWFIVGEIDYDSAGRGQYSGLDVRTMKRSGFEAEIVNKKVYARMADASGLPLSDFVVRRYKKSAEPLPVLATDAFAWTVAELADACLTACKWLSGGRRLEAA